jgi:hypothetical protein
LIFLYLLTVLNTLSTVIEDSISFDSRKKKQNFEDIINFPTKRFRGGGGGGWVRSDDS